MPSAWRAGGIAVKRSRSGSPCSGRLPEEYSSGGRVMRWNNALGILALGLVCGCSREDTDRLGLIGQKAAGKLEGLSGGPHGKASCSWQALRASISDTTLDSRVAVRLRWDKLLAGADVRVRLLRGGVIH